MSVPIHIHTRETIRSLLETCSRNEALEHLDCIFTPALFKKSKKEFNAWAGLFLNKILESHENRSYVDTLMSWDDVDFFESAAEAILKLLHVSDFKSRSVITAAEGFEKPSYLLSNKLLASLPEDKPKLLNLMSASCLVEEFREGPDSSLWKNYTFVEVISHIPRMIEELHVCSHLLIDEIQDMLETMVHQLETLTLSDEQMLQASYVLSLRDLEFNGARLDSMILDRIQLVATKVFNPDTLELLLSLGPLDKYAKWCMLDTKYLNMTPEPIPFEV